MTNALAKVGSDAAQRVHDLMSGTRSVAPHRHPPEGEILDLVSVPTLHEGAALESLTPEVLFLGDGNWEGWRNVFLTAVKPILGEVP